MKKTIPLTPLSCLACGCRGKVCLLPEDNAARAALMRLGLVCGTSVESVFKAPGGDPGAYYFRNTLIALRNDVTSSIQVCPIEPEGDHFEKN